ncbi:MAG: Sua5/YciO/YrdC/YwlC family protein [Vicinamibacterales bacterium]
MPAAVTADLDTVALRVPAHAVARALIAAAGCPVAAPSANRFSRPSPTDAAHVLADLDGRVDMILDGGRTTIGIESTVLDLSVSPPLVRRPGGVTLEQLRTVIPDVQVATRFSDTGEAQVSPGQLLRHYAPKVRMTLYEGMPDAVRTRIAGDARALLARGLRVGILASDEDLAALQRALIADTPALVLRSLGPRMEPDEVARRLFDAIRSIDTAHPDEDPRDRHRRRRARPRDSRPSHARG